MAIKVLQKILVSLTLLELAPLARLSMHSLSVFDFLFKVELNQYSVITNLLLNLLFALCHKIYIC